MALDADVPEPPDLTNRGVPDGLDPEESDARDLDLRREDLEAILRDGAWSEGFEEWAQYTDLSAAEVRRAEELELFGAFDFFWDPEVGRLRYLTPSVPPDWNDPAGDDRAGSAGVTPSVLAAELDDLGRTVAETISVDYVDWGDGEAADLVWGDETFGRDASDEE